MKVVDWPIERVKPYPGNPRRNEEAVAKVAASLREFGWRQPLVVDGNGVVVVGHTRLLAARMLGMVEVPVHVAEGLTAAQLRAYRLADNRTNEESSWDGDALVAELRALSAEKYDLGLTGFGDHEVEVLLAADAKDPDKADVPALPAKAKTKLGEVIRMGPHTLVCGDATDPGVLCAALGRRRAQCVWTDPPYGVAYVGKTKRAMTIQNDEADMGALARLLERAFSAAVAQCEEGSPWYVAAPAGPSFLTFAQTLQALRIWRQTLVWVKNSIVLGHSDYHYQHEAIFYGWTPGRARRWYGDRKRSTVLRYDRQPLSETLPASSVLEFDRPSKSADHPTIKPVALVAHCLGNSARGGAAVLDMFAGSGTTLLACEQGGQVAACIELDPRYCDVIVERWEQASGGKAHRRQARELA